MKRKFNLNIYSLLAIILICVCCFYYLIYSKFEISKYNSRAILDLSMLGLSLILFLLDFFFNKNIFTIFMFIFNFLFLLFYILGECVFNSTYFIEPRNFSTTFGFVGLFVLFILFIIDIKKKKKALKNNKDE